MRCCMPFCTGPMQQGLRHVLVITGKGASFGSDGVLRQAVPSWFSTPLFKPYVSAYEDAARHHGGQGALYVRLAARSGSRITMTPFGERLRALRQERGLSQKDMAKALHVSAAYLSALEHGRRSQPTFPFVQRVIGYFNIIWDEAEELQRLAQLSQPRVTVDTAGLDPLATEVANLVAQNIRQLDRTTLIELKTALHAIERKKH